MKTIIVLVAHGTVDDLKDIPGFLHEIRRGRPAPPELVAELEERYRAVGGSPHLEETRRQARALQEAIGVETRVAMRLWKPKLREVVDDLSNEDEIVLVPMAPYSVAVYEAAAQRELSQLESPPSLTCVEAWGNLRELIEAHCSCIAPITRSLPEEEHQLILTAHSLPVAVIQRGDRYTAEFEQSARAVADALGRSAAIAYQSQGASGDDWVGPTLEEAMIAAKKDGKRGVVVAPIGFLSEHIETLYDLDIEAKAQAEALGLSFERAPTLGADPGLLGALQTAIRGVRGDLGSSS